MIMRSVWRSFPGRICRRAVLPAVAAVTLAAIALGAGHAPAASAQSPYTVTSYGAVTNAFYNSFGYIPDTYSATFPFNFPAYYYPAPYAGPTPIYTYNRPESYLEGIGAATADAYVGLTWRYCGGGWSALGAPWAWSLC